MQENNIFIYNRNIYYKGIKQRTNNISIHIKNLTEKKFFLFQLTILAFF